MAGVRQDHQQSELIAVSSGASKAPGSRRALATAALREPKAKTTIGYITGDCPMATGNVTTHLDIGRRRQQEQEMLMLHKTTSLSPI